jgi:hypothetical protein
MRKALLAALLVSSASAANLRAASKDRELTLACSTTEIFLTRDSCDLAGGSYFCKYTTPTGSTVATYVAVTSDAANQVTCLPFVSICLSCASKHSLDIIV